MKRIITAAMVLVALLAVTGCATTNELVATPVFEGGPDNSVLVIGSITDTTQITYSQMNPEFNAENRTFKGNLITGIAPIVFTAAPGSRYSVESWTGSYTQNLGNLKYVYKWDSYYPLQGTILDFYVPEKTGSIYIYDSVAGYFSLSNGKKMPSRGLLTMSDSAAHKALLKSALQKYKGTEWESVIQKEIERIKDEN